MRHTFNSTLTVSLLLLACLAQPLRADEVGDKGRAIFNKNRQAVVTVQVVQKTTDRSGPKEAKQDLTGTVIDPSGLTVLALSAADPAELYRRLSESYKTEVELSDIKILLEDGQEVPAEIVLRDKDLDLAFLRPKSKLATPMTAIDLSKSGTAQVLDEVVTLNRLKRGAGRAFSASVERISAVVQKPRTFYIPDSGMSETGMGSPAFNLNGSLLGIFVMRAVNAQGASNLRDCLSAIILPAEDILKAAAQAPEAKGGDEKKSAPKEVKEPAK